MGSSKQRNNVKNAKKQNGDGSDDNITISKKTLKSAVIMIFIGIGFYYIETNQIRKKILHEIRKFTAEKTNPFIEPVDTSKKTADFIQPYIEEESHPNPNVRNLPNDLQNWPPGEMGIGVNLVKNLMNTQEKTKRQQMYKNHAFEEYVSELIALNRSLPDFRGQWCRDQYDGKIQHLEKVSIIICFHNEAWSTLLRSVHSILNRTPKELIEEILLVDDKSDKEHLGQRLDDYVNENFENGVVKVIRQEKRQGLMRSRMTGENIFDNPGQSENSARS